MRGRSGGRDPPSTPRGSAANRERMADFCRVVAWGAGELPLRGRRDQPPLPPHRALRARPRRSPRTIARGRARGRERSERARWGRCRSRSPRRGQRAGWGGGWRAEGFGEAEREGASVASGCGGEGAGPEVPEGGSEGGGGGVGGRRAERTLSGFPCRGA
jgi:hypothetical protein